MPIVVSLYKDNNLKSNVKYRSGGLNNSTPIATLNAVSNGAMANKNIYADNSIEISTPIETAAQANYITLKMGNTCIAGEITGLDYINENNTNVQYAIDYFTTAQMTGALRPEFFTNVFGHCERTNLTYPGESIVNQQPEPYHGGDYRESENDFTRNINLDLGSSIQVNMGNLNNSPTFRGYALVLWISSFAAQAAQLNGSSISLVNGWQVNPSPPRPGIERRLNFRTDFASNVEWYGGISNGYPIVFTGADAAEKLTTFVNALLSEVGIEVIYPKEGLATDTEIRRFVTLTEGNMFYPESDDPKSYNTDMSQVRLIGSSDILRVQMIPGLMASANSKNPKFATYTLNTGKNLSNFNPLIDERTVVLPDGTIVNDYSKSKLMTYPYWYYQCVTASGDSFSILPQEHMSVSNYINTFNITFWYKLTGGDRPCLQVTVLTKEEIEGGVIPEMPAFTGTWYTVYEFPTIAWTSDVSSEQQLASIQSMASRKGDMQAAIIGAATKGTGFQYGIRGGQASAASQGTLRSVVTGVGNAIGSLNRQGATNDFAGGSAKMMNDLAAKLGQSAAGRIIQTENFTSGGGDSITALSTQPIRIYRAGMSYGELFGFGRYIDRQGQTCHLNGNPITNSFNVFGGNASITSYGGKTYYQFSDIDVSGTMPVDYKNAIQLMFVSGCYLMG